FAMTRQSVERERCRPATTEEPRSEDLEILALFPLGDLVFESSDLRFFYQRVVIDEGAAEPCTKAFILAQRRDRVGQRVWQHSRRGFVWSVSRRSRVELARDSVEA